MAGDLYICMRQNTGPSLDNNLNQCRFIVNTLRPRENDLHFPCSFFKYIFLKENVWIFYKDFTDIYSQGSN